MPEHTPICDRCNARMVVRARHSDLREFYGCSRFPLCKHSIPLSAPWPATNPTRLARALAWDVHQQLYYALGSHSLANHWRLFLLHTPTPIHSLSRSQCLSFIALSEILLDNKRATPIPPNSPL